MLQVQSPFYRKYGYYCTHLRLLSRGNFWNHDVIISKLIISTIYCYDIVKLHYNLYVGVFSKVTHQKILGGNACTPAQKLLGLLSDYKNVVNKVHKEKLAGRGSGTVEQWSYWRWWCWWVCSLWPCQVKVCKIIVWYLLQHKESALSAIWDVLKFTSGLKGTVEHSSMYFSSLAITPLYSWYFWSQ